MEPANVNLGMKLAESFLLEAKIGNLTHDFDGKLLYPYMKAEEYNALLLKELQ